MELVSAAFVRPGLPPCGDERQRSQQQTCRRARRATGSSGAGEGKGREKKKAMAEISAKARETLRGAIEDKEQLARVLKSARDDGEDEVDGGGGSARQSVEDEQSSPRRQRRTRARGQNATSRARRGKGKKSAATKAGGQADTALEQDGQGLLSRIRQSQAPGGDLSRDVIDAEDDPLTSMISKWRNSKNAKSSAKETEAPSTRRKTSRKKIGKGRYCAGSSIGRSR
mmetsp:Transcript_33975/g.83271  ORF Transcript_33975/g.83271 Transcript_33975/m.83271 type:complete len:227 (+) Transcript_33975:38-718(+)